MLSSLLLFVVVFFCVCFFYHSVLSNSNDCFIISARRRCKRAECTWKRQRTTIVFNGRSRDKKKNWFQYGFLYMPVYTYIFLFIICLLLLLIFANFLYERERAFATLSLLSMPDMGYIVFISFVVNVPARSVSVLPWFHNSPSQLVSQSSLLLLILMSLCFSFNLAHAHLIFN